MNNTKLRILHKNGELIREGKRLDTLVRLHPDDFASNNRLNEALTIPELDQKINDLIDRGLDGYKIYQIEKYMRIRIRLRQLY